MADKASVTYCWGRPGLSPKFHIFYDARSLCMKWAYFSADEPVGTGKLKAEKRDCKNCVRRFNKMMGYDK